MKSKEETLDRLVYENSRLNEKNNTYESIITELTLTNAKLAEENERLDKEMQEYREKYTCNQHTANK